MLVIISNNDIYYFKFWKKNIHYLSCRRAKYIYFFSKISKKRKKRYNYIFLSVSVSNNYVITNFQDGSSNTCAYFFDRDVVLNYNSNHRFRFNYITLYAFVFFNEI